MCSSGGQEMPPTHRIFPPRIDTILSSHLMLLPCAEAEEKRGVGMMVHEGSMLLLNIYMDKISV